jgi:hypothetical protein
MQHELCKSCDNKETQSDAISGSKTTGKQYSCACGKGYTVSSGLWSHQQVCAHLKEASNSVKTTDKISAIDMCLMIFKENNDFNNEMLEHMKQLIDIKIENKKNQINAINIDTPISNDAIENNNENNELSCVCGKDYARSSWLWRHKQTCTTYKTYASNNNIYNPVCNISGCTFGTFSMTNKCFKHISDNRCNEPSCTSGALGISKKCFKHGGGQKCSEIGCTSAGLGIEKKCIKHGGGKRCIALNCNASARDSHCKKHGGGKRCNVLDCKTSAQGMSGRCIKHGGGSRCSAQGCTRGAYDTAIGKCVSHGGGPRCPNCITWLDSRAGTAKYDGYCATCFKRTFPDDERSHTIYSQSKEMMVRNIINENFKGFIHNTPIYTGNCDCTHRRRIDHRKMFNDTILAVETDEFGHRGYDKHDEEIRYDDLYMIHSGKWIFIRFNPDDNVSKIDIVDKLNVLIETIDKCISRIETGENTELVEIIKLFC